MRALLLAAGLGTRLRPFTETLPKCLMPVRGRPLLEYWLEDLRAAGFVKVMVNLHCLADEVRAFLDQARFREWVQTVDEPLLLGTGGTLRANRAFTQGGPVLVAHADNLCRCDLRAFFQYHVNERPARAVMTMMTFHTATPQSCGIVVTDKQGVVCEFHEKVAHPPGNLANAAVYVVGREVEDFLAALERDAINFSTEVIPRFLGRIATWPTPGYLLDIGTPASLQEAQNAATAMLPPLAGEALFWDAKFQSHPVHALLSGRIATVHERRQ